MYLLFDLDGTLTEPSEGITNSIKYALKKLNIIETDMNKLRACIGPPLVEAFMEHWGFDHKTALTALRCYREYFAEKGIFENRVYDGIPSLLSKCACKGHKIILATSKPEEYATQILEHFDLLQYFTFVAGNTLSELRPKKSQVLAYILEKFPSISSQNTYMIGDRKYDVEGARQFALPCIGVLHGHGSRAELESAGADYIVQNVNELERLIIG